MEVEPQKSVAAIIVNYHKASRVVSSLASLRRQTMAARLKIAVVDNSVSCAEEQLLRDNIQFGEALFISPQNIGYTRAVNIGVGMVGAADYVLLVNPDIVIDDPTAIQQMTALMDNDPSIGILATLQRNDDGSPVEVARRYPSLILQMLRRIWPDKYTELSFLQDQDGQGKPMEVDWVQSSFIMIPRAFWTAVGGLDERYRIFMSDIEICRRAYDKGLRVVVTPAITVRADGLRASRGSLATVFRNRALRIHMRDALIYHMTKRSARKSPDAQ
jgi:N-acetylglucosaminyl-diphospho-decaprenol L-rhamnosyltransferase